MPKPYRLQVKYVLDPEVGEETWEMFHEDDDFLWEQFVTWLIGFRHRTNRRGVDMTNMFSVDYVVFLDGCPELGCDVSITLEDE